MRSRTSGPRPSRSTSPGADHTSAGRSGLRSLLRAQRDAHRARVGHSPVGSQSRRITVPSDHSPVGSQSRRKRHGAEGHAHDAVRLDLDGAGHPAGTTQHVAISRADREFEEHGVVETASLPEDQPPGRDLDRLTSEAGLPQPLLVLSRCRLALGWALGGAGRPC
jgi:hypothetical protein